MNKAFAEIKNFILGDFEGTYNCGEEVYLRLYNNSSEKAVKNLLSLLEDKGFKLYEETHIDNLNSYTLVKNNVTYVVNFSKDKALRVIYDSFTKRLNKEKSNSQKCPVRFWQFEVDHSMIDCGMCCILQCPDYSFFIIDSAHFYSINDDKRIYDFLRSNTPDSLPVRVSGWYFSHGHEDHITKFMDILKFNKDIIIEGLYFNFVPVDHVDSGNWMESTKNFIINFNKLFGDFSIPIYKIHSGQYFYIDSVRFDILCTHEDIYPNSLADYNDSSACLMITAGEDKILIPGDGSLEVSKVVEKRYPKFLNCNIVQSAHHGHFGTREKFYELANAEVVLFPTTEIMLKRDMPLYKANQTATKIAKHYFVASNGTVGFTLPLKDSEITLYPDETVEDFKAIYDLWGYEYTDDYKKEIIKKFNENKTLRKIKY